MKSQLIKKVQKILSFSTISDIKCGQVKDRCDDSKTSLTSIDNVPKRLKTLTYENCCAGLKCVKFNNRPMCPSFCVKGNELKFKNSNIIL